MKNKAAAFFLLILLTVWCITANTAGISMVPGYSRPNMAAGLKQDELRLISIITPVRPGSVCSMIIQGKPGVTYTATYTYMLHGNPNTEVVAQTAGGDGMATWTWVVKPATTPGTYQVTVSGGGQTLETSYIVAE